MREYWGEHIYRTIVETKDFAMPSEDNVGEIHKHIAQRKRAVMATNRNKNKGSNMISSNKDSSALECFNIIELSHNYALINGQAGKALIREIENAQLNQGSTQSQ